MAGKVMIWLRVCREPRLLRSRCWPAGGRRCRWGEVDVNHAREISKASPQKHLVLQHLLSIGLDHPLESRAFVYCDRHRSFEVDHLIVHEDPERLDIVGCHIEMIS